MDDYYAVQNSLNAIRDSLTPKYLDENFPKLMVKYEKNFAEDSTVLVNLEEIASLIHKDPHDLLEYLSQELPIQYKNYETKTGTHVYTYKDSCGRIYTLDGEFLPMDLTAKLHEFITRYVVCKNCSQLDTRLYLKKFSSHFCHEFWVGCNTCKEDFPTERANSMFEFWFGEVLEKRKEVVVVSKEEWCNHPEHRRNRQN